MDLLDDPTFKTKYQKHKVRVKLWESDFMEKYGRKPNKNDIREANAIIRDAYKMYWKLKTRALEEALVDITFSDDVQANVSANSSAASTLKETDERKTDNVESVTQNAENVNPDVSEDVKETDRGKAESTTESLNVDGVWGDHLNKSNESSKGKRNLLIDRSSLSFQLSRKMFTSVTFAKRNPRKSLSLTKLKSKPDLNLTAPANVTTDRVNIENENGIETTNIVESVFGETLKVVQPRSKVNGSSISAVQQLIEGRIVTTGRNLNQGWLERCSKENDPNSALFNSQRFSNTNDSGVESMESSMYSPSKQMFTMSSEKSLEMFDEEDFIYNSDSEEDRKNKRVRNIRKILSSGEYYAAKRPRLETQSHLSSSQPIHIAASSDSTLRMTDYSATTINNVEFTRRDHDSNVTSIKGDCDNLSSSKPVHDTCDIKINIEKSNKANDIKDTNNQDTKVEDHKESTIVQIQKSVSSSRYKENAAEPSELERAIVSDARKKVKGNNVGTSNSDREDTDYEDVQIKTRKVKRAPRKPKESLNTEKVKKPVKVRRSRATDKSKKVSTRKRESKVTDLNEDIEPELTDVSEIPVYGVESLEVVPRFALSKTGAGDLVTDLSKVVSTLDSQSSNAAGMVKPKANLTNKEKLERKVASGKLNDNFVRINIKKKVFVRGKKSMNFSKYKKNQWKQRKKELASSEASLDLADFSEKNVLTCFKCGDVGHFAKDCKAMKHDELLPLDDVDESSEYPTLEEAERMASEAALVNHNNRLDRLPERPNTSYSTRPEPSQPTDREKNIDDNLLEGVDASEFFDDKAHQTPIGYKIPEDLIAKLLPPKVGPVKPLYSVGPDDSLPETPDEVFEALHRFGHESFRPGQEKAVMRILSGQSTLVTLSTGAGKSLCYQLPAYLYAKHSSCITLVVSPLVSLMDDQVTGVPTFLSAACLHTNQTPKQRKTVMDMVKQGNLNILLLSPEAVVAGERSTGFGALLRQLPPIAFACVDEAHCISQWSHNFRPSYLMVSRVLKEKLNVHTILGLTATAARNTAKSIVQHLDIHDGLTGIISDLPLPNNLMLTISKDKQKDRALIELLRSARFEQCYSIIVYCTRREECVRVAELLRAALQDPRSHRKISNVAEAYHAGLPSYRRKSVQKAFMRNEIRIVVATIAFGMGINKPDIRSVIHYNMPSSFERYVQEVGRAGRDGLPAQCHLFLDFEKNDKNELQRHIYANGVDRHTIRRLLQKIFVPCSCTKVNSSSTLKQQCPGHEVAIPVDETVRALDISQEMISTLLCYLELHPKRYVTVLSSVYTVAKVISYKGPKALKAAAQNSPPLAMAIALDIKEGTFDDASSVIEFPVVDIAAYIGWDSGVTKSHLKNLEWTTDNGTTKRSAISVRYDTLGLRVKAPGDLTNTELDEALDELAKQSQLQELSSLKQLEAIYNALNNTCALSIKQCLDLNEDRMRKSDELKVTIRNYFQSDSPLDDVALELENKLENEAQVASDIRNMISSYRDTSFTGRAIARIFHGIQSPNYSALAWSRSRFWRAHLTANFNSICQIATKEILAMR